MLYTEARKRMVAVLSVNDIKVKPEEINDGPRLALFA